MKRLLGIAVLTVALLGASCSQTAQEIITLTIADQATLASGQSIAVAIPWTLGSAGGHSITAYVFAGANMNATSVAAALAAINGTQGAFGAHAAPVAGTLVINPNPAPGVQIKLEPAPKQP